MIPSGSTSRMILNTRAWLAEAMAEPRAPEDIEIVQLTRFLTSRKRLSSYKAGKFLSVEDIFYALVGNEQNLSESERRMLEMLVKVRSHCFHHTRVPIPVRNLQHVTEERFLHQIISQGAFRIIKYEDRPNFKHLSFWSAHISSEDLEGSRLQAYEAARGVITPSGLRFEGEIKEQFGNSPAFNTSTSRYGNFRFSFPLTDLLSLYRFQYCGGKEPQMRILGTELYRLEIAHYVLVHSPNTKKFDELPKIPSNKPSPGPLPVVYLEDGTLYWNPESTSIALKVKISEDGVAHKECYEPCSYFTERGSCCHLSNATFCVWNHLILAFHLPSGYLKIPKKQLLENLTVCGRAEPYLGNDPLRMEDAEEIVRRLRDDLSKNNPQ